VSDFLVRLLVIGPMFAVIFLQTGVLLPGAFAVAFFSVTRHASFLRNVTFGGLCLAATAVHFAPNGDVGEIALIFIATSIPFAILALITIGLVQLLHRFVLRLEKRERENIRPNS
jgi:hypothetical protein